MSARTYRSARSFAILFLLVLFFFHLIFILLSNHTQKSMAPSRKFLRRPALEEPIKAKDGKLCDILFNPVIHIRTFQPVMIQSAEKIAVFFLTIYLAFCYGIIEFQFLHRISNRFNLLFQQRLQVVLLFPTNLSFRDTLLNPAKVWS